MKNNLQHMDKVLEYANIFLKSATKREKILFEPTFNYFTTHIFSRINTGRLKSLESKLSELCLVSKNRFVVLDIACGAGLMASVWRRLGYSVVGVDFSKSEILLAKRFFEFQGLKGTFLFNKVDSSSMKKILDKVNPSVVIFAYSLHHLPEVEKIISILYKFSNCKILVNEEDKDSLLFKVKHFVRSVIQKDTEVESQLSYSGWKGLFEKVGYTISKPEYVYIYGIKTWSVVFSCSKD